VRLWRVGDGAALSTLAGTEGSDRPGMAGVAFAPDGRTLAGVGQNRRVFLWALDQPNAEMPRAARHRR
jgi:hypothetical protein